MAPRPAIIPIQSSTIIDVATIASCGWHVLGRKTDRTLSAWGCDDEGELGAGTTNWDWQRKFVRHRVNDAGLIRLLNKWLKAVVMQNGVITHVNEGVPQGGPVSPVLLNIYLHYVLDLWSEPRFTKTCRGYAELTRFADDFSAAFRERQDADPWRRRSAAVTSSEVSSEIEWRRSSSRWLGG